MKKKNVVAAILLLCWIFSNAQTPDWSWVKNTGGNGWNKYPDITKDALGNIYVACSYEGDSITVGNITLKQPTTHGDVVIKYDPSGNVIWAKSVAGFSHASIASDNLGNIYLAGLFQSQFIFGIDTMNINHGYPDIFLAKYNSNGDELWVRRSNGNQFDECRHVAVDVSGNVYITGSFLSDSIKFEGFTLMNSSQFNADIFLVKYDPTGHVIWATKVGGSGGEGSGAIEIGSSEKVYLTGSFQSSTVTFGNTTLVNSGSADIFLAQYDSTGNPIWAKKIGGNGSEFGGELRISADGDVLLTGMFESSSIALDTIALNNVGSHDIFIAKYNPLGNVIWARSIGGNYEDHVNGITTDETDNIYLTGMFESSIITFGSSTLINSSANQAAKVFVLKYSSTGNPIWAKSVEGYAKGYGITCDAQANIYITGEYWDTTIFGNIVLSMPVKTHIFTAKLNGFATGIFETEAETECIISPNPTSRNFTIVIPPTAKLIQISNSQGQILQSKRTEQVANLDFEIIESGIYFIRITAENFSITKRIIVAR